MVTDIKCQISMRWDLVPFAGAPRLATTSQIDAITAPLEGGGRDGGWR